MYRDPAVPLRPPVVLYDGNALGIATFLGSPIGGAVLWAVNERRAGRPGRAWGALGCGLGLTVVLLVVGAYLPSAASLGATLGAVFAVRHLGEQWLTRATAEGRVGEVVYGSNWKAVGVGLASLVVVLATCVGVAMWGPDVLQDRVTVGASAHVYYDDGVDRAEAQRLGEHLQSTGFLRGDHAVDVRYARTPTGHAVSLVVPAGGASPGEVTETFRHFAQELQPYTDPNGVLEVRLCDPEWHPHDRVTAP